MATDLVLGGAKAVIGRVRFGSSCLLPSFSDGRTGNRRSAGD